MINFIDEEMTVLSLRVATEAKQDGVSIMGVIGYHSDNLRKKIIEEIAMGLSNSEGEFEELKKKIEEIIPRG